MRDCCGFQRSAEWKSRCAYPYPLRHSTSVCPYFCRSNTLSTPFCFARAEPIELDLGQPGPGDAQKCAEEVVLHLYHVSASFFFCLKWLRRFCWCKNRQGGGRHMALQDDSIFMHEPVVAFLLDDESARGWLAGLLAAVRKVSTTIFEWSCSTRFQNAISFFCFWSKIDSNKVNLLFAVTAKGCPSSRVYLGEGRIARANPGPLICALLAPVFSRWLCFLRLVASFCR